MHFVEAKAILSAGNGMNIYRGCTHGCIYCDTRSLCYGFSHPFTDIEVKRNAPALLESALRRKRKRCMIGTGAMCDPYLHLEEKLGLTRECLSVIDRYGFGVAVQTKSARILRDIDLLSSINRKAKAVVQFTVTTADPQLCRILEPNVSDSTERFAAIEDFRRAGIPVIVWLSPVLPFLNDTPENLLWILEECARLHVTGIMNFGFGVTLRDGSREYFYQQLDKYFPGLKENYIANYQNSYELPSLRSAVLWNIFHQFCEENHILHTPKSCFAFLQHFPESYEQTSFF